MTICKYVKTQPWEEIEKEQLNLNIAAAFAIQDRKDDSYSQKKPSRFAKISACKTLYVK